MYFHEYFVDFDGDFGAFDEKCFYNFVPYKRPPFSLFFLAPGALKGANTVLKTPQLSINNVSKLF